MPAAPSAAGERPAAQAPSQEAEQPAGEGQPASAPAAESEKPKVSDDDWDILERIFSKKR